MNPPARHKILIGLVVVVLGVVFFFWLNKAEGEYLSYDIPVYDATGLVGGSITGTSTVAAEVELIKHLPTPEAVKAVYMTSCAAITPSLRNHVLKLIDETELNSIVLDLKDYTGAISFNPLNEALKPYAVSHCPISDLKQLVADWHDKGIYVIGRITVFQDPLFTKNHPTEAVKSLNNPESLWRDKKGITYIDPASKLAHDHIISIARDAYDLGVDELNFDYIRFPSDGNMKDILLPITGGSKSKPLVLEEFFAYLAGELKPTGAVLSAAVFGVITNHYSDVGIGQIWEHFLPYFDYISPMIYPSHYYSGFGSFSDPNLYPYEVVKDSLDTAVARTVSTSTVVVTLNGKPIASTSPQLYSKPAFSRAKIRPWLQDFDYPVPYTPDMVTAQIKATYDAGLNSWMMWDPTNTYTKSVYKMEFQD